MAKGRATQRMQRLEENRESFAGVRDHFIVCGAGDTGQHILTHLAAVGWPFLAIETDDEVVENLSARYTSWMIVHGDATDDDVLRVAGVERAKGLATVLPEDRDNLVVIVSARQLKAELRVVSRFKNPDQRGKLEKAGATVISPNEIGGRRLAAELVRPSAATVLNQMLGKGLRLEAVIVESGKPFCGKTLGELDVFGSTGMKVLALAEPDAIGYVINPAPQTVLAPRMQLFVAGDLDTVRKLAEFVGDTE